jgi:hypothetical protein
VEGIDFEFSYTADLEEFTTSFEGGLGVRFLWSHQPTLKTLSLPSAVVLNQAGTALAPNDRITVIMSYSRGPFGLNFLERYQSSYRQSANPTLVYAIADVRAYLQTDLDLSYDFAAFGHPVTGFLSVDNVFNVRGGLYQSSGFTGNPGMNYPVGPGADIFGRYFTIGLRLNMP